VIGLHLADFFARHWWINSEEGRHPERSRPSGGAKDLARIKSKPDAMGNM